MARETSLCAALLLLLLCYSVESCIQRHVRAEVPKRLKSGYAVAKVDLGGCGDSKLYFSSSDPNFDIQTDGTILAVHATIVPSNGKSFRIIVQNHDGYKGISDVTLVSTDQVPKSEVLKRTKRRWSPPPFVITENDGGPFPREMDLIGSDSSTNYSVYYTIDGPGVDREPRGVLSVKPTGMVQVHRAVDREAFPRFAFIAHVFDTRTRLETDKPLPITVIVKDVNDNAPEFSSPLFFTVQEHCNRGTVVGQVNATDKDEAGTDHTKIKFSLLNYTDMFFIDPFTGVITTISDALDREAQERVFINMEIRDMGGAPNGLFRTGVAAVSLTDINDNPPTFKEKVYKGQVMENKADVLVLRIPVEDKDLKNTPNWKAVYEITKGNETGNFMIKTDPVTNDALLYIIKPLDYEKQTSVNLEVMARNEVPLVKTILDWQKVPVEIAVQNEDEGPEFSAPILKLNVKENVPNGTLIGTYTATDPETKSSKGIKYYKMTDPGSWITVVESTGELKTANTIDRESPLVYNDMYNITVRAVDESRKTGTGMVLIQIEDVNDNAPVITKPDKIICSKDNKRGSTLIEAVDGDKTPYAGPFSFALGKEPQGKWKITRQTATSALLEPVDEMPNGIYKVPVVVKDLQSLGEEQIVNVRICECVSDGQCKPPDHSTKLGVWGILAMLLGLLLLLLLCLLCALACTTKAEKLAMADDDAMGGLLLKSNSEAPGEEVKDPMLLIPDEAIELVDYGKGGGTLQNKPIMSSGGESYGRKTVNRDVYQTNTMGYMTNTMSSGQYGTGQYGTGQYGTGQYGTGQYGTGQYGTGQFGNTFNKKYSNVSTIDTWRSNGIYLQNKLLHFGEQADGRFAADVLKPYGYEGAGSAAGSVGCCSILGEQDSLDFLDSLGPKFKTLADVCMTKKERGGM